MPDVICITETKLDPSIDDVTLGLKDYNIWRKDRADGNGGGVAILTKKGIITKELEINQDPIVEMKVIEVETNGVNIIITTVYMPPQTSVWSQENYQKIIQETLKSLEEVLQFSETNSKEILITGDFNSKIDWESFDPRAQPDSWNAKLLEVINDHCLFQNVTDHTRIRGLDRPSMLDLIFTKHNDDIKDIEYCPPLGKSDHVVIKLKYCLLQEKLIVSKERKQKYNYKRGDYRSLKDFFDSINWETLMNDENLDVQYSKFCEIYKKGVEKFISKFKIDARNCQKWFNDKCKKMREKKHLLWKRFRRHRSQAAYERYKVGRNEYTQTMREAKLNFEKDIINKCTSQPKLFFNYINSKTKSRDQISAIKDNNIVYSKEEEMCEILNEKFQSVFVQDPYFYMANTRTNVKNIENITLKKNEIKDLLKGLDKTKAEGPDEISNWVLKECAEELCTPLLLIFQNSLRQGKLPKSWKLANVTPLYKSGDKQNPLNYRPVSLTSVVCKLLERIIRKQWVEMLEKHKMISNKQFGFREGRSCVTNLLCFYDRVSEILQERDGWVDCVYLDFKKAFDKVSHKRLLWKLEHLGGVKGKLLAWMEDFLHERQMSTVIRGKHSTWRRVTSGVPQGSVLAPIMFTIFVNDLESNISPGSYLNMFADDAKIQKKITDNVSCQCLQSDIENLFTWSCTWKMEFNTNKCHVVRFGESRNRPLFQYKLGDAVLDTADREKDLGIIINKSLNPNDHINEKVHKMLGLIANMKRAFLYVDEDMVKKIITAIIRPSLEYGAVVWSPHLKKDIDKLERVQRAATRWAPTLRDLSYEDRLQKLGLITLEERRKRGDMIMLFNCITGRVNIDKDDFLILNTRKTRGHNKKLIVKRGDKDVKKYSFPNRTIESWNSLPNHVVCAKNVHQFKKLYDNLHIADGTT